MILNNEKLEEKPCLFEFSHDAHDWYRNSRGRMVAGSGSTYYHPVVHYWCNGILNEGRHKGDVPVGYDDQTNRVGGPPKRKPLPPGTYVDEGW